MPQQTLYRPHFPIPDMLVRAKASQTIECPIYNEAGTLTAPTSGTVSVVDGGGVIILDEQAVVIVSDIATGALLAADLPASLSFSADWLIKWTITIGTPAETHVFIRSAHLIRSDLWPTVTEADLIGYHQNLDRLMGTGTDIDDFVTQAWLVLIRRLLKNGRLPELILSPYVLHDSLVYKSLEMIFRDGHAAAGDGKYEELASFYHETFEAEWASLTLDNYDFAQDGQIGEEDTQSAEAVVFLGGPGVQTGSLPRWP